LLKNLSKLDHMASDICDKINNDEQVCELNPDDEKWVRENIIQPLKYKRLHSWEERQEIQKVSKVHFKFIRSVLPVNHNNIG
jgi:hypothetical protein